MSYILSCFEHLHFGTFPIVSSIFSGFSSIQHGKTTPIECNEFIWEIYIAHAFLINEKLM